MVADDRELAAEAADRLDDLRPEDRMGVHLHPLFLGEALLLEEDCVGHADLADIVEKATPLQRFQVGLTQVHYAPDVSGDLLYSPGVPARERVALVDRSCEGGD